MRRPDEPPDTKDVLSGMVDPETARLAREYNDRYLHWSDLEYRDTGPQSREVLWALMKHHREATARTADLGGLVLRWNITGHAHRALHDLDLRLSHELVPDGGSGDRGRLMMRMSSVMEESIASSQLEGASTTTREAKRMLREGIAPSDRSERMILNNYHAMRFIKEHSGDDLTPGLIREIHSIVTRGTLDDPRFEGRFREDDSIVVGDALTGETYHVPPGHETLGELVDGLCGFANDDGEFVHPIVKAIMLHFALAYIHPFVDGNGRTARSLFYWHMLRSGYASVEYLSISRIIIDHRGRYESAYLLSETDGNDVTYFIDFNLDVVSEAADRFEGYVRRKMSEIEGTWDDRRTAGLSPRQREILADLVSSAEPMDVYQLASRHMTPAAGVRRDLERMCDLGLVVKVRRGHRFVYMRGE